MLTPTKKKVLNFIGSYSKKHGLSPSLQEICGGLKLKSVSTIHQHIDELEESGYLRKENGRHRSIEISKSEPVVKIPLLGIIAAGQPIEAIQNNDTIDVPRNKVPYTTSLFALTVQGNSMINENIHDGDTILVKSQPYAENGQT